MLALINVPQASEHIKCVKGITLHSSYLGSTAEVCLSPQALGTGPKSYLGFSQSYSLLPDPVVVSQLLPGELLGGRCVILNPRPES